MLTKTKRFFSKKGIIFAILMIVANMVLNNGMFLGSIQPAGALNSNQEIPLSLEPRNATTFPASDIYVVSGRAYTHISELLTLMGSHGLLFYESGASGVNQGPHGLVANDDVVLIKTNCQWDERGGTNTDLLKELIQMIVDHPDGFVGEIVVADNGQAQYGSFGNGGSLNWANNNAEDPSQSVQDVVDMFSVSFNVSTYLWDTITHKSVGEYSEGDLNDGYVINQTANPVTGIKVSYPKFKTEFGTHISFKKGVWNPITQSYSSEKLKVINFPVLKSHSGYGVTASMKHYMGVVSAKQTNAHDKVATGGMGTEMVETRFPTLNILDGIWVNANPAPSSSCGPGTPYAASTRVNVVMASTDPVALAYWGSKHILMQAAELIGYADTHTLNPDNTDPSGIWGEAFGVWLNLAKNEIVAWGYNVTIDENQMNVYLKSEETPAILLLSPENKTYSTNDVPLNFIVNKPTSWIGYSLDGQANVTVGGNTILTSLMDGSHSVIVYANYTAGNMGASNVVWFTVDTTPPTIVNINQSPSNPDDGEAVTVSVTSIDQHSGVNNVVLSYRKNGGSWVNIPMTNINADIYEATIPGHSAETHVEYRIAANDVAGHQVVEDNAGSYYVYTVIPESPSFLILSLFMMVTLLIIVVYRRKHSM
ncbi:MAG: DUF362 domain-containing protein [Candidatus Bathyarchaeota archaeon]|nr:DUF362 domain-containing protein [Candidatus Bathyarchaeota archaeon]